MSPTPVAIPPDGALAAALDELASAGGVLEVFRFAPTGLAAEDSAAHESVARAAAALFAGEALPVDSPTEGRRIPLRELFGPRFVLETGELLFPTSRGLLPAEAAARARAEVNGWASDCNDGLAGAFSDPPYTLRLPLDRVDALFRVVWDATVGTLRDDEVVVMTWSTDAWPAFDAGREWWGSSLWTVARRDGSRFAAFAASSTD
jgi:hypothetical protein